MHEKAEEGEGGERVTAMKVKKNDDRGMTAKIGNIFDYKEERGKTNSMTQCRRHLLAGKTPKILDAHINQCLSVHTCKGI